MYFSDFHWFVFAAQIDAYIRFKESQERWGGHLGLGGELKNLQQLVPLIPCEFEVGYTLGGRLELDAFVGADKMNFCRMTISIRESSFRVSISAGSNSEEVTETTSAKVAAFAVKDSIGDLCVMRVSQY